MGNELMTQTQAQLPAHLQAFRSGAFANVGSALAAQATSAGHARISIKASRFRLNDSQGEEFVVPQHFIDVIVVDANPNKTKTFYMNKYNPAETEFKAPDCFSNNGLTPSPQSTAPQCGSCAACPHNVWGSKVTPSGAQTKACADSQRLAVILADNPDGPVYELKIPAASITNLAQYAKSLDQRGIPIPGIITRIEFDTKSDFPKLLFKPQGWATPQQVDIVTELMGSEEVDICTGKKEQASAPKAIAAPTPVVARPPAPPADPFDALMTTAPDTTMLSYGGLPAPAPAKRTRKKAEAPIEMPQTPIPTITPVAQAVPLTTPVTDQNLDDLISSALQL